MLAFSLLVALGGYLFTRWYGNKLLFLRTKVDDYDPITFPIQYINGVSYIYDRQDADTVIVFSHGSGGNMTDRQEIRRAFQSTGYGLILYDYYGYGASREVPTMLMNEAALTRAAEAVMELTRGKRVVLMGSSLGCYPTCWLASKSPANLLCTVLGVPFDSIGSIVRLAPFFLGSYDNKVLCRKIQVPTLLIRAEHDQIIPWDCCDKLMECLGDKGSLITVAANHQNYLSGELIAGVDEFIKRAGKKKFSPS